MERRDGRCTRQWRGFGAIAVAVLLATAGPLVSTSPASAAGARFVVVRSPNPVQPDDQLNAVSCVSAASCVAVGSVDDTTHLATLVESWDGAVWSVVPSPSAGVDSALLGVACAGGSACMAVGYSSDGTEFHPLAERWDGVSWTISPVVDGGTPGPYDVALRGVACLTDTSCIAVGNFANAAMVQTWNGVAWSVATVSNRGRGPNRLNAVACTSPTECIAVGRWADKRGTRDHTLTQRLHGTKWAIRPSPDGGTLHNTLDGVACVKRDDCVAVGSDGDPGTTGQLAEHWDGARWTVTPTPPLETSAALLQGISCSNAAHCVAVGSFAASPDGSDFATLVQTWSGTVWTTAHSANANRTVDDVLAGVSCAGVVDCAAVGRAQQGSRAKTRTLVLLGPHPGR